jgi:hypothetical protein
MLSRVRWDSYTTLRADENAGYVDLAGRLRHVHWIGGGSGAGKSTIARRMAAEYGLRLYATDEVMSNHADRCPPGYCPFLDDFKAMDMDERWLNRSPETMLETFHWFHRGLPNRRQLMSNSLPSGSFIPAA